MVHRIGVVRVMRRHMHMLARGMAGNMAMHLRVHLRVHLSRHLTRHGDSLPVSVLKRDMSNGRVLIRCTGGGIGVVLNRNLNVLEARVSARLSQLALVHVLPSVVTDQMELQASCSSDTERLLEETTFLILETLFLLLWAGNGVLLVTLHLSVCQE